MARYQVVALDSMTPDPTQPRKTFDEKKLLELAASIKANGVIDPVIARPSGEDKYILIDGERRWRASRIAELDAIPAVIVDGDEVVIGKVDLYSYQLLANMFRQDLNPVEKAEHLNRRLEYLRSNGEEAPLERVAKELGVSKSWVSKATSVLKYPEDLRALARGGKVKDYKILKRVADLDGDRREKALDLIDQGKFNSKEFFSKKKPQKKEPENLPGSGSEPRNSVIKVTLKADEFLKVIRLTNFEFDPEDIGEDIASDPGKIREIAQSFKVWLSDCSALSS